jgi:hypothetical protein
LLEHTKLSALIIKLGEPLVGYDTLHTLRGIRGIYAPEQKYDHGKNDQHKKGEQKSF